MAIVRTTIMNEQKPTEAQIKEIEEASKRPISFDEDSPELTSEQYAEMAAMVALRSLRNCKKITYAP